ncbi:hypothetical protein KR054_009837 [Drosophila jambulina]|nr:hypothetical protein KR054_009837 [Drosophila jambulina]
MRAILVVCVLALAIPSILARTMDRCSLAREMSNLGVPRDQLDKWACIAEIVSSYRTDVKDPTGRDYGIFQINDALWCQPASGSSANGCGVNCNDLLSDDITKSVQCAQKIQRQQGWAAWAVWSRCSGSLPSINDCF